MNNDRQVRNINCYKLDFKQKNKLIMKIGDLVKCSVFPFENDTFEIIGSKSELATKRTPFKP